MKEKQMSSPVSNPSYTVILETHCHKPGDIRGYSIDMQRTLQLPFVPVVGMSIGFEEDSDFSFCAYNIEEVFWNVPMAEFRVKLEDTDTNTPEETAKELARAGWVVRTLTRFATRAEAEKQHALNPELVIAERDGIFYRVAPYQLAMFEYIAQLPKSKS